MKVALGMVENAQLPNVFDTANHFSFLRMLRLPSAKRNSSETSQIQQPRDCSYLELDIIQEIKNNTNRKIPVHNSNCVGHDRMIQEVM